MEIYGGGCNEGSGGSGGSEGDAIDSNASATL